MAQKAVPPLTVLALLGEESPVDGHASGVAEDGLDHAPEQHQEKHVEHDQQDDVWGRTQAEHELEHEHVVVEGDEADHPDEVRVRQTTAVHSLNYYHNKRTHSPDTQLTIKIIQSIPLLC